MSKIKVKDYGDILALKCDGEKVYYSESGGSYQGQYVAVVKAQTEIGYGEESKVDQYYVFIGSYGSCSGCDWLQAEGETDYDSDDYDKYVDAKAALEYASQSTPLYILQKKPTKQWVDNLAKEANKW